MLQIEIEGFLEACIAGCVRGLWDNSNELLFFLVWGGGFLF